MRQSGYSHLSSGDDDGEFSKGEAERQSRRDRRYGDKSKRFRGDKEQRSRSRNYGRESRRNIIDNEHPDDHDNDIQHRHQVEYWMDVRCLFYLLFCLSSLQAEFTAHRLTWPSRLKSENVFVSFAHTTALVHVAFGAPTIEPVDALRLHNA